VIRSCDSQSAGERELGRIVAIHTGDVLIVRACQRLLGLHDLHAVCDTRSEAILGTSKVLVCEIDVAASNIHLFPRCVQVQEGGAYVVIDLPRMFSASAFRCRSAASAWVISPLMRPPVKTGTRTPAATLKLPLECPKVEPTSL